MTPGTDTVCGSCLSPFMPPPPQAAPEDRRSRDPPPSAVPVCTQAWGLGCPGHPPRTDRRSPALQPHGPLCPAEGPCTTPLPPPPRPPESSHCRMEALPPRGPQSALVQRQPPVSRRWGGSGRTSQRRAPRAPGPWGSGRPVRCGLVRAAGVCSVGPCVGCRWSTRTGSAADRGPGVLHAPVSGTWPHPAVT